MAFFHQYPLLFLICSALCLAIASAATQPQPQPQQQRPRPGNLVVRVRKDAATGLHVATVLKRTPPVPIPLVVDLNGPYVLVNCESGPYLSASYNAPSCRSTQCSLAAGTNHPCLTCSTPGPPRPGCHNGTCGVTVANPFTRQTALGELAQDSLSVRTAGSGRAPPFVRIPQFLFVCAPPPLLQPGLPRGALGVLGLGHSQVSLPTQLAASFGLPPTFATCLARGNANGAVFIGAGPYSSPDVTRRLTYTPLTVSQDGQYFINLNGIRINNKVVRTSVSRALISTTIPYTVLEHSIYAAVTRFFYEQFKHAPQVEPVAPFGLCFDERGIAGTPAGPAVPPIDLVLPNGNDVWRIIGANSMVEARPGTLCLAFVDGGGYRPGRSAITIGAYQLEEVLVQIDLRRSMLGFSSSLLLQRTSCSNLNV